MRPAGSHTQCVPQAGVLLVASSEFIVFFKSLFVLVRKLRH